MSTALDPGASERHRALLPIADGRRVLGVLGAELNRRRRHTAIVLVSTTLYAALVMLSPRLIGRIVDQVVAEAPLSDVVGTAVLLTLAGVGAGGAGMWAWGEIAVLGQRVLASLRERVIDQALSLPQQDMERAGMGDALSRVADDVDVAATAFTNIVPNLLTAAFTTVFTLAGLGVLDLRLLLPMVAAAPIYALALRWYLPRTNRIYRVQRMAMGARAEALLSAVQGAPTIHAYAIEDVRTDRVSEFSRRAYRLSLRIMRLVSKVVLRFVWGEVVALALVLGTAFVLFGRGEISIGQVTAGALYVVALFWPMSELIFTLDDLQSAGASLARMVGVLDARTEQDPPAPRTPSGAEVRAEGVAHAYGVDEHGAERTVLHPTDLTIRTGETIALVGASGAGKSTLAAILAGTLAPLHGRVLYGGVDLADTTLGTRRAWASIVAQDAHVFRGTLAADLRLAAPAAEDRELWEALRRVGADAWVAALPQGLATEVGEKGLRLTAEQAQHLALARVVLDDPVLLVLDEATAEAGSWGARDLEDGALAAAAGRTAVIVAHRLSQARRADRILVLADGHVVEEGTHEVLVAAGGRYGELWAAWSG